MKIRKTLPMGLTAAGVLACAFGGTVVAASPSNSSKPGALRDRPLADYVDRRRTAATDVVVVNDYADRYADDIGDTMFFAPGVWVNALDIHEPRIVLRGFGIANRQERSTVPFLRDGAPLTDVHGTTNTQEIDPLAISRIDIYRGGGGDLRFTGDNLGGAVNIVSPTGTSTGGHGLVRFDAGTSIESSPGGRAHASFSGASNSGGFDYYASLTGGYETGFRDQNERNNANFNGNIGIRITNNLRTRFFVEAVRSDMKLAGGVLPADGEDDPNEAAGPIGLGPLFPGGPFIELADGAITDDFGREVLTGRVSNQTNFSLLGHDIESGFHFTRREMTSPQIDFVGFLEEEGHEWGARLALSRWFQFLGMDTKYRVGGSYSAGEQDSDRFENIDGSRGDQLIDSRHKSANVAGFVEAVFKPLKRLVLDAGAKFIMVDRELAVDDGDFEELRFTGVTARGGAMYQATNNIQVFANAHRTYEPPSFSELISDNPADFNSLDEQDAFTYEGGFRGFIGENVRWDITYFNTDVEGEIVNADDPETNGLGGTLVNTASTTHKGVELGLDLKLLQSGRNNDGGLTLRSAYSYNNFTFTDAGPLGVDAGNNLAGIPEHVYRGELRYDANGRWYAAVNVQVAAGDFYADHENLVTVPTYAVVGFTAGLQLSDQLEIFASGVNLTDFSYAGGVTPITSQATQNARFYTPAARASVYGGLRYQF